MKDTDNERRKFFKSALGAGLAMTIIPGKEALAQAARACGLTPAQTEGPFYPQEDFLDKNSDLTQIRGKSQAASGKVILVRGKVVDQNCRPIHNAHVEIWQASESGRYLHEADPNTSAAIDPNFQYFGRSLTTAKGSYLFKTIKPGAYPATPSWTRPPHIHFKVSKLGYHTLTTQMYFEEETQLNSADNIIRGLTRAERDNVIAKNSGSSRSPDYSFQIVLRKV